MLEALELQRRLLDQLRGSPVGMATGSEVAVRHLDQILEPAEVDALVEQTFGRADARTGH